MRTRVVPLLLCNGITWTHFWLVTHYTFYRLFTSLYVQGHTLLFSMLKPYPTRQKPVKSSLYDQWRYERKGKGAGKQLAGMGKLHYLPHCKSDSVKQQKLLQVTAALAELCHKSTFISLPGIFLTSVLYEVFGANIHHIDNLIPPLIPVKLCLHRRKCNEQHWFICSTRTCTVLQWHLWLMTTDSLLKITEKMKTTVQ